MLHVLAVQQVALAYNRSGDLFGDTTFKININKSYSRRINPFFIQSLLFIIENREKGYLLNIVKDIIIQIFFDTESNVL